MKFADLLTATQDEAIFETGLLLSGDVDANDVRRQLSRWVNAGRVLRLRRGLYTLAPPFRRSTVHPYEISNRLEPGSYVSLHSALEHFGLIPERVARVTSVGGARPRIWETPLGTFETRHMKPELMRGFDRRPMGGGREAYVAWPEKALLDLVYLEPKGDDEQALRALRLQNLGTLDLERLRRLAEEIGKPKLQRAAQRIADLARQEAEEYEEL